MKPGLRTRNFNTHFFKLYFLNYKILYVKEDNILYTLLYYHPIITHHFNKLIDFYKITLKSYTL